MSKPIEVYRGEFIESTHEIHIAVVDHQGKLLYSYGDPYRLTFPRSSMKPFQTIPLLETGAAEAFQLGAKELAISCGSHTGEAFHREVVLDIMKKLQLPEQALQCGYHIPFNHDSYVELIKAGKQLSERYSNCSGKHAGMLATALHHKEDIASYRELTHPVQERIVAAIAEVCDFPKEKIAISVDGCGVPVHQLPLYNAALGFARLAKPEQASSEERANTLQTIRDAMLAYPEMVAGTDRFDTDIMQAYNNNIIAKVGAEAVQCVGVVDKGIGIAIKVEDGMRGEYVATMEVLKQLSIGDHKSFEKLAKYVEAPVLNMRKEKIGVVKANFSLTKHA